MAGIGDGRLFLWVMDYLTLLVLSIIALWLAVGFTLLLAHYLGLILYGVARLLGWQRGAKWVGKVLCAPYEYFAELSRIVTGTTSESPKRRFM